MNSLLTPIFYLSFLQKCLFILVVALKLSLVVFLPITGDEAYFLQWGQQLALGYYDHPPVIGWIAGLLGLLSQDILAYRGFAILTSVFVAWLIYKLVLKLACQAHAFVIALAYFLSPIALIHILYVNDVALVLFGISGFAAYWLAQKRNSLLLALLAGILLALALLSKYFAIILFFGIAVHAIYHYRSVNWLVIAIVSVVVMLGATTHLYYNLMNCWETLTFNMRSRTTTETTGWQEIFWFFATLFVLISPLALWQRWKTTLTSSGQLNRLVTTVFITYIVVFFIVSWSHAIGYHWFAMAIPFGFILLAPISKRAINGLFTFSAIASALLSTATLLIFFNSHQIPLLKNDIHKEIGFDIYADKLCEHFPKNARVMTNSYAKSAMLDYYCKSNTFDVLFNYSKYGRQYDKWINLNEHDNKPMIILLEHAQDTVHVGRYFTSHQVEKLSIDKLGDYYLFHGSAFDYESYRQDYLITINERYYQTTWLQGQCDFQKKYSLPPW